jgi:hypothetical protein
MTDAAWRNAGRGSLAMKRPAAQFVLDNEKAARRRSVGPFPAKPNERAERGPKEILSVSIAREGSEKLRGLAFHHRSRNFGIL